MKPKQIKKCQRVLKRWKVKPQIDKHHRLRSRLVHYLNKTNYALRRKHG